MIPEEIQYYFTAVKTKGRMSIERVSDEYMVLKTTATEPGFTKYFCGYTWLKKTDVPDSWLDHSNIHYDLNIHGGLTFSEITENYVIYGFDCDHLFDDDNPKLKDPDYIMQLCQEMRSELKRGLKLWCEETRGGLKRVCGGVHE